MLMRFLGYFFSIITFCNVYATQTMYRSYWNPLYHGHQVSYCMLGDKICGRVVADNYCKMMHYTKSSRFIKGYNLGYTNYLHTNAHCQGWTCHGFRMINCVGAIKYRKTPRYLSHTRTFVLPRYNNYRVAYCNVKKHECGKVVANSFCKRMGYLKAIKYNIEQHVLATRTINEQKLCFGPICDGFASIICYR